MKMIFLIETLAFPRMVNNHTCKGINSWWGRLFEVGHKTNKGKEEMHGGSPLGIEKLFYIIE